MCPKVKLGRSIVGRKREGGGEIGKKKLTEKGLAVMLQMGCKVIERHYAGGGLFKPIRITCVRT